MSNPSFRFGKLPAPAQPHKNAIPFGAIVKPGAAVIAPGWDWTWKQGPGNLVPQWPVWGNDKLPDCVFAGMAGLQTIEAVWGTGKLDTPTDAQVIAAYHGCTGGGDRGVFLNVGLDYWKRAGIAGHRITAYTSISPWNQDHLRQGIFWFGGVLLGMQLPNGPSSGWLFNNDNWDLPPGVAANGVWAAKVANGHAVAVLGYDATGVKLVSWGRVKHASWKWIASYMDEAYAAIGDQWVVRGTSPQGMNLAALQQALKAVAN